MHLKIYFPIVYKKPETGLYIKKCCVRGGPLALVTWCYPRTDRPWRADFIV